MSFLNEAKEEAQVPIGRKPSKLAEIEKKLGPKQYKEFVVACKDEGISSAGISRALKKRGVSIASNTVSYLRRQLQGEEQ